MKPAVDKDMGFFLKNSQEDQVHDISFKPKSI